MGRASMARASRIVWGALSALAVAAGADAQPAPPVPTKGEKRVQFGPLHPGVSYRVVIPVLNKCSWTQPVTLIKSGGVFKGVPVEMTVDPAGPHKLELDKGSSDDIYRDFNHQDVRITFVHDDKPRGTRVVCMERRVIFDTLITKDDKALSGSFDLTFPTIVLEEVSKDDFDAKRYRDPNRPTSADKDIIDKKQPGEGSKKTSMRKALPWIGGGAGVIVGAVALGGGGGGDTPAAPSNPSLPLPPPPSGALFCGTYMGQLEPTQVACGFSTGFPMSFALTCSSNGAARLVIARADNDPQGQRFEYTGTISPAGVLDFSGTGNLRGLATYTGHFTGVITGNGTTLEGTNTVTFTEPGCQGQTLVQRITGVRAN